MIILLPLLRKLSIHTRRRVGALLVAVGLVAVVVALVAVSGLFVEAVVTVLVGAIFRYSAWRSVRAADGESDDVAASVVVAERAR